MLNENQNQNHMEKFDIYKDKVTLYGVNEYSKKINIDLKAISQANEYSR